MDKPKLELELIPDSCCGKNAREGIWKKEWTKIRKIVCWNANYHCEICKKSFWFLKSRQMLECNEVWEFDREFAIQKLVRLEAICYLCHETKHWKFFYSSWYSREESLLRRKKHLQKVNSWNLEQTNAYIKEKLEEHRLNNQIIAWKLVISPLDTYLPARWKEKETRKREIEEWNKRKIEEQRVRVKERLLEQQKSDTSSAALTFLLIFVGILLIFWFAS
jgi:hypothetical protein